MRILFRRCWKAAKDKKENIQRATALRHKSEGAGLTVRSRENLIKKKKVFLAIAALLLMLMAAFLPSLLGTFMQSSTSTSTSAVGMLQVSPASTKSVLLLSDAQSKGKTEQQMVVRTTKGNAPGVSDQFTHLLSSSQAHKAYADCDPTQPVNTTCTISNDSNGVFSMDCTPLSAGTDLETFDCTYLDTGAGDFDVHCDIPTTGPLQNVHPTCTDEDTELKGTVCSFNSYQDMAYCNGAKNYGSNNDPCLNNGVTANQQDPITGLPLAPTPVPAGVTPTATATTCPVVTPDCTTITGDPTTDWLTGTTGGLLLSKNALDDTTVVNFVQGFWFTVAMLAIGLLAIPFALAGYQIMLGMVSSSYANAIQVISRVTLVAFAIGLSYFFLKAVMSIEGEVGNWLYTQLNQNVSVAMPSAKWGCYSKQFFGSIFDLSVYSTENAAKQITTADYARETATSTLTLIENLSNFVLTLLSVVLAIQLIVRLALLNFHVILSPLAILCEALPEKIGSKVMQHWLRGFFSLLFVQLLQLVIMAIGSNLIPQAVIGTQANDWGTLLFGKLIPIAIMLVILNVPRLFNNSTTTLLSTVSSSFSGAMTGIALIIRGL